MFDMTNPVEGKCGDLDLGAPNERCGGPGIGEDGEPDGKGPNCLPLGNVLIVQEPGSTSLMTLLVVAPLSLILSPWLNT